MNRPNQTNTNRTLSKFRLSDLQHLGLIGVIGIFFDIPYTTGFILFYLIPFIKMVKPDPVETVADKAARDAYLTSYIKSMMNPRVTGQSLLQMFGQINIALSYGFKLPDESTFHSTVRYRLPFNGWWNVAKGGVHRDNSHSWEIFTQRYAYDLYILDDSGKSHRGDGTQLTDYYCFDQPVFAPADGTVVALRTDVADYTGVGDSSIDWRTRDFRGNHVVIRQGDGEFIFIAHFKQGSIQVAEGDCVSVGQELGRCGNSGFSTEPHIHIHLQSKRSMWTSAGLPLTFSAFERERNGQTESVDTDFLKGDDRVRPI